MYDLCRTLRQGRCPPELAQDSPALESAIRNITLILYPFVYVKITPAQEFADAAKMHLHAVHDLGIGFKPKHHEIAHAVKKLLHFGTPALWGNWREESENKDLKTMAQALCSGAPLLVSFAI